MSIEFMNGVVHFFRRNLMLYAMVSLGYFFIFGHSKMNSAFVNDNFFSVIFFPTFFAGCVMWAVHTMRNIESN